MAEMLLWFDSPIEDYSPVQQWFDDEFATSSGQYSLTASTGTFTLNGNIVRLQRAIAMVAVKATYTQTGNNVSLTALFKLLANVINLNCAVFNIQTLLSLRLTATTGSFNLTGNTLLFGKGYFLQTITSSYGFIGNNANLKAVKTLICSSRAFALTGYNTKYYRQQRLNVSSGTFNAVGFTAALKKTAKITVNTSVFSLEGVPINLVAARIAIMPAGYFNLTGNNIDIPRYLIVSTGSFYLIGYSTSLESDAPANSFGGYGPNNEGLTEVLIDFKLTLQAVRYPTIGFTGMTFETINQGQAVYLRSGDGKVGKAVGNLTEQEATVVGFAQTTKGPGEEIRVLTAGKLPTSGLTPGALYFLASAGAGSISPTPPSTLNQFITRVGEAISSNELLINIEPTVQIK